MTEPAQINCSFHGLSIQASGPGAVISALAGRLGSLPPSEGSAPDIKFEFHLAPEGGTHSVNKPSGEARHFYAPAVGEALYYANDDLLFLDSDVRARAVCHPADGSCCVSLLGPELDQLWLATHPFFTLPLLEMLKRRRRYNVHAACFARGGRGLICAGTSGAGKSTLAIALLLVGFDFLGDDMVFLEQNTSQESSQSQPGRIEMLAFPEKIDISDGTVDLFKELSPLTGRAKRYGWPKHEIQASDVSGSKIAWRAEPKAMVFPQISHQPKSRLTAMKSDDAFLALAPNVLLTEPSSTQAHLKIIADLVNQVPAYRLSTGTDFADVSRMLSNLLL